MKRRVDTTLGLGIFAVVLAALFGVLAVVDRGRIGPEPAPPTPFPVSAAVTPDDARAAAAPVGGNFAPGGRLEIGEVPPTRGRLEPLSAGEEGTDSRARRSSPVPMAMLAGIRGFYRLGALPPEELERPIVTTLEYVFNQGRLVLVDGCFRFDGPTGPLAVFGPETRLGLVDGYLVVGRPGFPPRYSARVGELVGWEGKQVRRIDAAGKDRIRQRCGRGEVVAVKPWSLSVQKAEADSRTATEIAARMKLGFAEALALLRRCGDPARRAIEGGPVSRSIEEACRIAHPQAAEPPPPPPLPQSRP